MLLAPDVVAVFRECSSGTLLLPVLIDTGPQNRHRIRFYLPPRTMTYQQHKLYNFLAAADLDIGRVYSSSTLWLPAPIDTGPQNRRRIHFLLPPVLKIFPFHILGIQFLQVGC